MKNGLAHSLSTTPTCSAKKRRRLGAIASLVLSGAMAALPRAGATDDAICTSATRTFTVSVDLFASELGKIPGV
jgi:hypothetical protein